MKTKPLQITTVQQMGRAKRNKPKDQLYKIVSKNLGDWVAITPNGGLIWSDYLEPKWFTEEEARKAILEFEGIECLLVPKQQRGGARPGAGRKKKVNSFKFQLKLTKAEYDAVIAKGGETYLRSFIRKDNGLCTHINNLYGVCSDCGARLDELQ